MARAGLTVVLVLAMATAGCGGFGGQPAPGPGEETSVSTDGGEVTPPYFVFANDLQTTWSLSVYLVDGPITRFRVTFRNGSERTVDRDAVPYAAVDIEPAGSVLGRGDYTVGPESTLFLTLRGCEPDTTVWFIYSPEGSPESFSYGPGLECSGLTYLEERHAEGGGSFEGGDYRHLLDEPGTVRRTLRADG